MNIHLPDYLICKFATYNFPHISSLYGVTCKVDLDIQNNHVIIKIKMDDGRRVEYRYINKDIVYTYGIENGMDYVWNLDCGFEGRANDADIAEKRSFIKNLLECLS